jgi:hypothetical protein
MVDNVLEQTLSDVIDSTKTGSNHYESCLSFAEGIITMMQVGETFQSAEIINEYNLIMPKDQVPKEPRVWGAVMQSIIKSGKIRFHSYVRYCNKIGHNRPANLWEKI